MVGEKPAHFPDIFSRIAAVVLSLHFLPGACLSQSNGNIFTLPRLNGSIRLDGLSNEPAWQEIAALPLTMHLPVYGKTPTERTEIRVAYDDDHLYLAARCYDSEPARIQGNSMTRDVWSASDDQFTLVLDTFNDNENAVVFITTPAGKRVDFTVVNDAVERGSSATDQSWNTFWDVAVIQNHEGWFAEMRIPFSSLRFQNQNGKVVMGLIAWRWIARKAEFDIFPAIPPNWSEAYIKPSVAGEVALENIIPRNPVYVTPYALSGVSQAFGLNGGRTGYRRIDNGSYEGGMDLKYNLTSNLNLDVSANTDFAQVEADDQQINLTRFSLFFPEKRQFFLERSGIFDFNTGGATRLFYSRRIGLSEQGKPLRIYGGARLVGRVGDWDVGFLDMQTAKAGERPSENSGVFRARRRVFNDFSYAGGMITSRMTTTGKYNLNYGLDGIFRLFGKEYLYMNWAQTFEGSVAFRPLNSALFRLLWERNANVGIGYNATLIRSGEHFNPGLGFKIRDNFTSMASQISYGWIPAESSSFQIQRFTLDNSAVLRNAGGEVESAELGLTWNGDTKSGAFYIAGARLNYESLSTAFSVSSNAQVPAGDYTFYSLNASYRLWGKLLRGSVAASAGSFYDGSKFSFEVAPGWSVSRFFQWSGFYQFNRVRFPKRGQSFDGHVLRLRATTSYNTSLSINSFVQWNSAIHAVTLNLRLRYNFSEGNDFYLVYNEALNTSRHRIEPALPLTSSRAIMAKYTYTFAF
jgi:hypothetical protein